MMGQTVELTSGDVGALDATVGIPTEFRARKVTAPRDQYSWLTILLLGATVIILGLQLLSLYTTPRPDCDRWHGDETWLMREFQTQMTEGVMRYPEAVGATIGIRNS